MAAHLETHVKRVEKLRIISPPILEAVLARAAEAQENFGLEHESDDETTGSTELSPPISVESNLENSIAEPVEDEMEQSSVTSSDNGLTRGETEDENESMRGNYDENNEEYNIMESEEESEGGDDNDVEDNDDGLLLENNHTPNEVYSKLVELNELLRNDPSLKYQFNLFAHCMKRKVTHAEYFELIHMEIPNVAEGGVTSILKLSQAPAVFQTLQRRITKLVQAVLPLQSIQIEIDGKSHRTPFLSLHSVVLIWLLSPPIRDSIQASNQRAIFPYITTANPIASLKFRIAEYKNYASTYGVDGLEKCSEFLNILLREEKLWMPRYQRNLALGRLGSTAVFLHAFMYQDDFGWMNLVNSKKGQTVVIVSAAEIHAGIRASPIGLGNIPLLLTKSAVVKELGLNRVLGEYTQELQQFAKGVEFELDGLKYLVFLFVYQAHGDTPARKRWFGENVSVVHRFPCPTCETPVNEFAQCALNPLSLAPNRSPAFFAELLASNDGEPGVIKGANRGIAKSLGIDEISVVANWPGAIVPHGGVMDLMHSDPLGSLAPHFAVLADLFKHKSSFWRKLSKAFHAFGKRNNLSARYDFNSLNSLKGLKGNGLKEFYLVVPYLIIVCGFMEGANAHLLYEFQMFCVRIRIFRILCKHSISSTLFAELKTRINQILAFYGQQHPRLVTCNVHFLHHVIQYIEEYGLLRYHWCFVYEHVIGILKACYANTNNQHVSYGVYSRCLIGLFIELLKQIDGGQHSCPKKDNIPFATISLRLGGDVLIDSDGDSEWPVQTLFTNSGGTTRLNWQDIAEGDWILLNTGGNAIIGIYSCVASEKLGNPSDLMLFRKPAGQILREGRQDGALQWLLFSNEVEKDRLYITETRDGLIRKLKTIVNDDGGILVVDIVEELL
ncbi:hypothetical protein BDR26DRAFT_926540 [Obelidium mucronatum]|nr:hypothetical protein BDR26DRAFT_926540 [Obelidium mucronatum]